jgi:hypothetical protein
MKKRQPKDISVRRILKSQNWLNWSFVFSSMFCILILKCSFIWLCIIICKCIELYCVQKNCTWSGL